MLIAGETLGYQVQSNGLPTRWTHDDKMRKGMSLRLTMTKMMTMLMAATKTTMKIMIILKMNLFLTVMIIFQL